MAASVTNMIRGGCSIVFQQRNSLQRIIVGPLLNVTSVRCSSKKHYDPRFKRLRREKTMFVKREDADIGNRLKNMTVDERRMELKKLGMPQGNRQKTREVNLASTEVIFDDYVPREGKGKTSVLSVRDLDTAKQRALEKGKFVTKYRAKRTISSYDQDFNYDSIAPDLQSIYIESQKLLTDLEKNSEAMFDYVTMNAFNKMTYKLDKTTVKWEFVESLEPPRVVHAKVQEMALKENYYAQVTLRIHLRQKLAIYDRFGRLMYGDPDLIKNILEYIVFENRIVSVHSRWRVHDKIRPKWEEEIESVSKTYVEDPVIPSNDEEKKAEQ